jgi:hypothetical protein
VNAGPHERPTPNYGVVAIPEPVARLLGGRELVDAHWLLEIADCALPRRDGGAGGRTRRAQRQLLPRGADVSELHRLVHRRWLTGTMVGAHLRTGRRLGLSSCRRGPQSMAGGPTGAFAEKERNQVPGHRLGAPTATRVAVRSSSLDSRALSDATLTAVWYSRARVNLDSRDYRLVDPSRRLRVQFGAEQ